MEPGFGYPERLERELAERGYRYRVVNSGISGDTTSGGRARLGLALELEPEIVILELGANDGLRGLPLDQARRNLEEMIVAFQGRGATVVLAGLTLPSNYGPDYIRSFEDMYAELSEKYDTLLIPFFLDGVAGRSELNLDDGIHPNREGYEIVARNVLDVIEPVLRGKDRSR